MSRQPFEVRIKGRGPGQVVSSWTEGGRRLFAVQDLYTGEVLTLGAGDLEEHPAEQETPSGVGPDGELVR